MTHFYYVRHGVHVWHIQIVKATCLEDIYDDKIKRTTYERVHMDFLANPDVAEGLASALNRS